jgi:folate-binding protein YgfZ
MKRRLCRSLGYALIEARGADAAEFLQGQLSCGVQSLDQSSAPLAGWHDARGRVRALFRVLRLDDRWLLATARDTLDATLKRLRMFVLRADVSLEAVPGGSAAVLVGADAAWLDARQLPSAAARNAAVHRGAVHWVHAGGGVWQALGPHEALDAVEPALARGTPADAELAEIELGIPLITAPLVERYVAQMLNLDRLDALSFDKGCYPGQEVIARVRHLGSVKRRLRRYAGGSSSVPAVGAAIVTADGRPAGEIVRAAPAPAGFEALAVVDDAAAGSALAVGGTTLSERALP